MRQPPSTPTLHEAAKMPPWESGDGKNPRHELRSLQASRPKPLDALKQPPMCTRRCLGFGKASLRLASTTAGCCNHGARPEHGEGFSFPARLVLASLFPPYHSSHSTHSVVLSHFSSREVTKHERKDEAEEEQCLKRWKFKERKKPSLATSPTPASTSHESARFEGP